MGWLGWDEVVGGWLVVHRVSITVERVLVFAGHALKVGNEAWVLVVLWSGSCG